MKRILVVTFLVNESELRAVADSSQRRLFLGIRSPQCESALAGAEKDGTDKFLANYTADR
jgi:hypothetical protein